MGCFPYAEKFTDYLRAGREDCTAEELRELAGSQLHWVRLRVAENRNTPSDVLELLAGDPCADVRIAVALNPGASPQVIRKLAKDEDPNVRYGIAEDPHAPYAVLEMLTDDPCPYVSVRARKTIENGCGNNAWIGEVMTATA